MAVAKLLILEAGVLSEVLLGLVPLSLGRAVGSDIVLKSGFVSGSHARLEPVGAGHQIVDLGSTNGLLCNGALVKSQLLSDGLVLRIGDPLGNFVTLTYVNPALTRASMVQRVVLGASRVLIGREGSGALVSLNSPLVSRRHGMLEPSGSGWVLSDLSTNGVFVNNVAVSKALLKPLDVIAIGAFRIVFDGSSLEWTTDPNALRVDASGLLRTVKYRGKPQLILNDVSLSIFPKEFVALVGGSGTGKSTLMKALSGFVRADSGALRVNGDDFYKNFAAYKSTLGYVPQDDIIHAGLPVERALEYAARLRLPPDTSSAELAARVEAVLRDVDLTPFRSKLVSELSGGQRKRVSIAVELLPNPSLLFLDEPTSGLDPGLEKRMMMLLRGLADDGRTVVLVTHATANITQCDLVAFMARGGHLVYYGAPLDAPAFFGVSSGDFADIYQVIEAPLAPETTAMAAVARGLQPELQLLGSGSSISQLWQQRFRGSGQFKRFVTDRLKSVTGKPTSGSSAAVSRVSMWRQFIILTQRYAELMLRDRVNLTILLAQVPIIVGLLLVMIKPEALILKENAPGTRYDAQTVLFMLATVSVWFGIINAAREITKESPIYRRERLVNLRVLPYLASKFVVLAGLTLVQSALLLGLLAIKLTYPSFAGLIATPILEFFITTYLTSLGGVALGLAVSAFASSADRAVSVVPIMLIPQIIFAGLIFKIEGAAEWLSKLTASHWAMAAFGSSLNLNQFCEQIKTATGQTCSNLKFYTHTQNFLLERWAALLVFILVNLVIAGVLLKLKDGVKE